MTDADDLDEDLPEADIEDDLDDDADLEGFGDEEETELDRTRVAYTGVNLDDEFQPVDAVELAEEGLLFDDPACAGRRARRRHRPGPRRRLPRPRRRRLGPRRGVGGAAVVGSRAERCTDTA